MSSIFPTILIFVLTATFVFYSEAVDYNSFRAIEPVVNRSPLLKPQTPIAQTNLYLNIPYKWHDRTRPKCYVTRVENYCNTWIVCSEEDQKWYDTPDATWILERTDGSESMDEYNGSVKIRNLASNLTIGHVLPHSKLVCVFPEAYKHIWNIRSDPTDKNNLVFEVDNFDYWLSQVPIEQTHWDSLWLEDGRAPTYPYSFVADMKLEANMYSFEFTEPPSGAIEAAASKKDLIDSYDINNNSPASLTREIKVSEKITNELAWGLSESFKIFANVKGKGRIPFVASTEVETGFEFTYNSNQNWKSSIERMFRMSYTVNVPPYTTVRVSAGYDRIKDISMDYTSETEITGKCNRITVFDDVVNGSPATGEMIRAYLEHSKFDGTIVRVKANSVITRIKGRMVTTFGLRGQLNVDGKPVALVTIPK